MDPLSGAASVIAVVTITGKIISLCTQYAKDVRSAKDDIKRLATAVKNVHSVLKGIRKLLERGDTQKRLTVSRSVSKPLARCSSRLKKVLDKLERPNQQGMSRLWARSLKWPFQSKELEDIISAIERYVQTFTAALQVDQTHVLLDVDQKLNALNWGLLIDRLPIAPGAAFDSYEEAHHTRCLDNTRVELRRQIQYWATASDSKCIYWLKGVSGTGKSTIARTMARHFDKHGDLGATYFFKRGAGDRSNARRFFTTIARQLAERFPLLRDCLADVVRAKPDLADKALKEQFENLILQPLSRVPLGSQLPSVILLVVDALDECEREEDIRAIIQLFFLCKDTEPARLRVLVMSRPELPIRLGFESFSADTYNDFVLQDIPAKVIEHDIKLFFLDEFRTIRRNHGLTGEKWPEESEITQLTRLAAPLFIFAATICRHVGNATGSPKRQLKDFLESIATN